MEREGAAVAIQALWRGYQQRKYLLKVRAKFQRLFT